MTLTVGSLFSGIGGLELGLERAGMTVRWQVEKDEWCRRVLAKHWPDVARYGDIKELDPHELEPVDVICGGFPCQPVSLAGRGRAQEDERWLWPEFARIVRGVRPRYVLVENVPGLLVRGFGDVLGDLATLGFDAEWQSIPAAAVGAPHLRWRVFLVAYAGGARRREDARGAHADEGQNAGRATTHDHFADGHGESHRARNVADPTCEWRGCRSYEGGSVQTAGRARLAGFALTEPPDGRGGGWWDAEPAVGRVAHGIPSRVDRLRGLGNAVVPQVAEYVGRRIVEFDAARSAA